MDKTSSEVFKDFYCKLFQESCEVCQPDCVLCDWLIQINVKKYKEIKK